jgi:TRAP-type mannitol/chloroaromatic compound transport system permease small subunit
MPSLNFVLPHWLYWAALIVFPLIAKYLVERQRRRDPPRGPGLFLAYLLWLTSGFLGMHRFYLRSAWGFVFIAVFAGILYTNDQIRDAREDVSRTRAAAEAAHVQLNRMQPRPGAQAETDAAARLAKAQEDVTAKDAVFKAMLGELAQARDHSRWITLLMAAMLLVDAALIPGMVRRARQREAAEAAKTPIEIVVPDIEGGTAQDPTLHVHSRITDAIDAISVRAGEFVAYWALLSVFGYYYEVVARFVFNSPTNWLHESMFLMYGMQYMIAGAYAYREDQHVRVDVFYSKFSTRWKAIADIITSVFFFIFVGTMLWTGARFAMDAIEVTEHSFTEWAVQYWPVKLMIPIGAALLLLQGISKLIKDIVIVTGRKA